MIASSSPSSGTPSAPSLVWHVLYGTLENFTGMVGLTPVEAAMGAGALFVLLLVYAVVRARTSGASFTFEEGDVEPFADVSEAGRTAPVASDSGGNA